MDVQGWSVVVGWVAVGMAGLAGIAATLLVRRKNLQTWLPAYIGQRLRRRFVRQSARPGPQHVLFCFVDHFEPHWRRPSAEVARARVQAWVERYPLLARRHMDADGVRPIHTFFFPEEEYQPEYLDGLQRLCKQRLGEIEIHLHHDHDTSAGFRAKLESFKTTLEKHRALPRDATGKGRYAFIHGNWCLDNSKPDGRWCGVNDELQILRDTGCYADFTLPAAPDPAQTRRINSIYYATDDPARPKSHDDGVPARVGVKDRGDLFLIQGPLALNWKNRSHGVFPKIENGDICSGNPPTPERVDLWVEQGIGVIGRPEWVFVKVHTHGAGDSEHETLLGEPTDAMFSYLERRYNDGKEFVLHYVSAREMYNIARAAEDGKSGNPDLYRDYEILRPDYGSTADRAGGRGAQVIDLRERSKTA